MTKVKTWIKYLEKVRRMFLLHTYRNQTKGILTTYIWEKHVAATTENEKIDGLLTDSMR